MPSAIGFENAHVLTHMQHSKKKVMHACREICFQFALALNIVKNCRDSIIQPMKESTYLNLSSVIGCVKRFLLITEAHHTIKKKKCDRDSQACSYRERF